MRMILGIVLLKIMRMKIGLWDEIGINTLKVQRSVNGITSSPAASSTTERFF